MYYDGFIHGVAFFMFSYILYNLIMFVNGHIRYKSNLHKFPSTVKAKDLCEKHTWSEDPITLAVKDVPAGKYTVCTSCGYISGTDHKLNVAGIMSMNESIKKAKAAIEYKQQIEDELESRAMSHIDKWINVNIRWFKCDSKQDTEFTKNLLKSLGKYTIDTYIETYQKIREEEEASLKRKEIFDQWGKK